MGYLSMGKCHDTLQGAVDAYYTAAPMQIWTGSPSGISYFYKEGSSWAINHVSMTPGFAAPAPTLLGAPYSIPCDSMAFDYAQAAAIFAFFFSFVVGVWFVSKNIGLIANAIRRF